MISSRVQTITDLSDEADFEGDYIVDKTATGIWRLYEDGAGYSSTSGQTIKKGKVVRDETTGMIRDFSSKEEAVDTAEILTDITRQRKRAAKKKFLESKKVAT